MLEKLPFSLLPFFRTLALISLSPVTFAAQNFAIIPNGPIPSVVTPSEPIAANFTLTNLTNSTRAGYFIVGLPATVTQDTSNGNCPTVINLAAKASCNLKFNITGAVNSTFAICKGNSCTTYNTPINVTFINANMIAGGGYCTLSTCYPLLARTQYNNWTYPTSIVSEFPLSTGYVNPYFYSTSCSGALCIAAGGDDNTGRNPLLAVSPNFGNTWTYPIGAGGWPSDAGPNPLGAFNGTSCAGNWCVAVGYYSPSDQFPMVAQSIDGGLTWNYAIDSTNRPPAMLTRAYLNDASCSGNLCVAGGTYEDNTDGNYYPLLAQSRDSGSTWGYMLEKNVGPLPAEFGSNGLFTASTCISNTVCYLAGNYLAQDNRQYPMLAQTTDGGASYHYVIDKSTSPQASNFLNGFFNSISCSGTTCVVVGYYEDTNNQGFPLALRGSNTSWNVVIDNTSGPRPNNFVNGIFNGVNCYENTCAVGGSYTNTNTDSQAMVAQSFNNGLTWTYVIDDRNPPPDYTSSGQFRNTACNALGCTAVGTYTMFQTTLPLIAQQLGTGAWEYVVYSNLATQPPDFINSGGFDDVSTSSFKMKPIPTIGTTKK